ncbi:MAG: hypothetical protein L0Z62_12370 [Gemmataceae bacterium]|nr:hypothetical protein [Gemmataceae bacterium]
MKRFAMFLCAGVAALAAVAVAGAQGPGGFPPKNGGDRAEGFLPFKGKADLVITRLTGTQEVARVLVRNQGRKASRATTLRLEVLQGRRVLFHRTVRVPALEPGETHRASVRLELRRDRDDHRDHRDRDDRHNRRDRDDRHDRRDHRDRDDRHQESFRTLRLRATVDVANVVPELNENNNTRTEAISFGR